MWCRVALVSGYKHCTIQSIFGYLKVENMHKSNVRYDSNFSVTILNKKRNATTGNKGFSSLRVKRWQFQVCCCMIPIHGILGHIMRKTDFDFDKN